MTHSASGEKGAGIWGHLGTCDAPTSRSSSFLPTKYHSVPHFRPRFASFSSFFLLQPTATPKHHSILPGHHPQDVLNTFPPTASCISPTAKIASLTSFCDTSVPPLSTPSVPRELNLTPLVPDAHVAITDQPQSPWLPPSSSSLPAFPSPQQQHLQQPPVPPNEDFVLFPPEHAPSRPAHPPSNHGLGLNNLQNRQRYLTSPRTPALEEVARARRRHLLHLQAQTQLANGAFPASTVAANTRLSRPNQRPPVPLFNQSANKANNNMELGTADSHLPFSFDMTSSSHPPTDIDLPEFPSFGAGTPISEFPSPANPAFGLDLSGSLHNSVISVSPNDLLLTDNTFSAPNSAALTQLTTPSAGYTTSPEFGFDCSPLFNNDDLDSQQFWSLFPEANSTTAAAPAASSESAQQQLAASIEQSPAMESEDLEPAVRPSQTRKSSAASSPSDRRHSSVSGVSARRRGRPLPPITIDDPSDMVGMKRAKNTLAARKSRARKAERMDELERQVRELEAEKEKLEAQVAHWKSIASARGTMA